MATGHNEEFKNALDRLKQDNASDLAIVLNVLYDTQQELWSMTQECMSKNNIIKFNHGMITRLGHEVSQLREHVTNIEQKQMANNIIIRGIPEEKDEDTTKSVQDFIKNDLQLSEDIKIDVSHRLGKQGTKANAKPRPMIVRLTNRGDIGKVLKAGPKLKDTNYSVNIQVPNALRASQSLLLKRRKELKLAEPEAKITVRGEQLWYEGALIKDLREVKRSKPNDTFDLYKAGENLKIEHTTVKSMNRSKFQGHFIALSSMEEVRAALAKLNSELPVAGATHNMWAAIVGDDELVEDDGEWGGSMKIMEKMQAKNVKNGMIVITRWFGGVHMGEKRFNIIQSLTDQLLQAYI